MASQTAEDAIARLDSLAINRFDHEWSWRQIRRIAAPDASEFGVGGRIAGTAQNTMPMQAGAARLSKDIYDSTAVWCVDRLASGMEALVVPQSEYWHGYEITSFAMEEASYVEKRWLERLRNLMFKVRYDADSGWIPAIQTCLRRMVAFGNAFMWVEEGDSNKALVRYRYLPLTECFVDENHFGSIDTFYRYYMLTARQAAQKFGIERLPAKIKEAANDKRRQDQRFQFIQCIHPRGDFGLPSYGVQRAPWASLHIAVDEKHIIGESGFFEFPVIDFRWLPEPGRIYGEGPVAKCLSDIQSTNQLAKNELTASDQAVRPPLLLPNAGVMNKPNRAPGANNFGGMSPDGKPLIAPLFQGQRLDFATLVLEAKRNAIKESLYINLFSILVQTPEMSATEALIRANEKGELLGPAGSRIQMGLSIMTDRELGILERKGLYADTSAFRPPPTLIDADVGPQFTGPLSRLRRTKEAEGTVRTLQVMSPLAQVDPEVADNFSGDEMARGLGEIFGMPMRFLANPEQRDAKRKVRREQQQAMANAQIAAEAAKAGELGSQALANIKDAGI